MPFADVNDMMTATHGAVQSPLPRFSEQRVRWFQHHVALNISGILPRGEMV
jgi:hypothetical protein